MKCSNCHKRKATEAWVGNGGILDYVHGNYSMWCRACVLTVLIESAKEKAKQLKGLEKELKDIDIDE